MTGHHEEDPMDIVILVVISLIVLVPIASLGWYRWRKMWEMRLEDEERETGRGGGHRS